MTPEEHQLITGLFNRMRSHGSPEKDREAETIINQSVRTLPDAPYMLVQSVLVQEHALQEAGNRIEDLEEQVRSLQGAGQARAPGSGSFLGGLFGGGQPVSEPGATSMPPIGSRAAPSTHDDERRPWGQSPPSQQSAPAPASGGFLRSAMQTAAGVAGGMLAAGAIRDMLGGGHAHANPAAGTSEAARPEQARQDAQDDARQDAEEDARQADARQDAEDDAADDSGNSGGNGDL